MKSQIEEKTFKQGVDEFIGCAPEGGWSDYWAMQQDWEFYKDSLCRDGVITQKQADSWSNPCTPETFARWQKRNGLVRRGYESKKSEGHDTIVDYFHSDPEVENSEALEDLTVTVSDNGCDTDSVMEDGESYVELCTWLPDGTSVAITVGICDDGNNDKATYAIDVGKTIGRSPITEWDKAYTADELTQMWVDFEDDLKKVIAEHPVDESKKKEPKGEFKKPEACKGGKDDDKKDGKPAESKKNEGIGNRIKMGIDYNMFMRMCGSAAYLDDNEDYWDALWEYYSEMGEIEDACEFFDNLFQYTSWGDADYVYDECLSDKYKDESKSKEECIDAAIDDGDLQAYKHETGNYLVVL